MNTPEIIKSLQEAQIAFRMLATIVHDDGGIELCKHHDKQIERTLEQLTANAP